MSEKANRKQPKFGLPEPLCDLKVASMLIPMRLGALRTFLWRHKEEFPPRHRFQGSGHRRVRLLSASEIKRIRAMVVRGDEIERAGAYVRAYVHGSIALEEWDRVNLRR